MRVVSDLTPADRELYNRAVEIATRAYAPYSGFFVGAAARARDGAVHVGVNVENAAYPLGLCAEKNAIAAAAAAGVRPGEIAAVGINASPCGGCRQWMHEWRVPEVSFRRADGTIATYAAGELLPDTWNLPG